MEIKIKTKGLKNKNINEYKRFQGTLKHLGKKELNKLKNNILRNGFISPIFTWENNIIDGHQRITAVKELIKEGHSIKNNELPYIEISADNKTTAAKYVLAYNSQFGEITREGLIDYKKTHNINLEKIREEININLNIERVIDHDRIKKPFKQKKDLCPICKRPIKQKKTIKKVT